MMDSNKFDGVRVRSFLVELETGEVIYRECPLPTLQVIEVNATPVIEQEEEKPKPKRGRGRPRKNPSAESAKPTVSPSAKRQVTDESSSSVPATKPRGLVVPLEECKGILAYKKKDGTAMLVAIYKHGKKKDGKDWYLCLFISKCQKWAYSAEGKAWFASAEKIIKVELF